MCSIQPIRMVTGRRECLAANVLYNALQLLERNGGGMDLASLRIAVAETTDLDAWALTELPHGKTRWCSALERYSHEYVKAGFISKHQGQWHLTDQGRSVLTEGADRVFQKARAAYDEWLDGRI